eukprot:1157340-Pelagomonas_calceolata.AAC.4
MDAMQALNLVLKRQVTDRGIIDAIDDVTRRERLVAVDYTLMPNRSNPKPKALSDILEVSLLADLSKKLVLVVDNKKVGLLLGLRRGLGSSCSVGRRHFKLLRQRMGELAA